LNYSWIIKTAWYLALSLKSWIYEIEWGKLGNPNLTSKIYEIEWGDLGSDSWVFSL